MSPGNIVSVVDAVTAKVRQLRTKYEKLGFEVIEHPGPEYFPFDIGDFARHPPAILARRGEENLVFEFHEVVCCTGSLADRVPEVPDFAKWRFYLTSLADVVPDDAPGLEGDPPEWPHLEHMVADTMRAIQPISSWMQLLALWTALEGVLRRIAVDDGIPVDLLSGATLVEVLHGHGLIPRESLAPLMAAHEVHRLVRHGFAVSPDEVAGAVHAVSAWLPALFPASVKRAA